MGIRIRHLRLRGLSKNYDVSFVLNGTTRPLSVISGEISTGKTSILEFIDYCLGARTHPQAPEIQRTARAAFLEIDANGEICVIERPLFSSERAVWIHRCTINDIGDHHAKHRKIIEPISDSESLSMFLLDQCGLGGLTLKESPTQQSSGIDTLSFRDVMWLGYLTNRRIDNRYLLNEQNHMMQIKLQQVVSILFGVHDDQVSRMSDQLRRLEERRKDIEAEVRSLERFLSEHDVPNREEHARQEAELLAQMGVLTEQMAGIDAQMRADTDFAEQLRQQYATRQARVRQASALLRDRETLLRRLLPLRAQYAEDERKLVFVDEARRLFDPLRVVVCPSCLQHLATPSIIDDGTCSLCGQAVQPTDDSLDVQAEIRSVRERRVAIERYIAEVELDLEGQRRDYSAAAISEAESQRQLDDRVGSRLSPYVAQRESLVRQQDSLEAALARIRQQLDWHDSLDRRRMDRVRLEEEIATIRAELQHKQSNRIDRATVVYEISERFRNILETFGFPKLHDPEPPYLDDKFSPHVRGLEYRLITSSGAQTLIALAWMLAVFEGSVEGGHPHPGFLMIDSPQKNLTPLSEDQVESDEFRDPAIAQRVWRHIWDSSMRTNNDRQIIVVDNRPPPSVDEAVVVRYSGRRGTPPYGLIDDEE